MMLGRREVRMDPGGIRGMIKMYYRKFPKHKTFENGLQYKQSKWINLTLQNKLKQIKKKKKTSSNSIKNNDLQYDSFMMCICRGRGAWICFFLISLPQDRCKISKERKAFPFQQFAIKYGRPSIICHNLAFNWKVSIFKNPGTAIL